MVDGRQFSKKGALHEISANVIQWKNTMFLTVTS